MVKIRDLKRDFIKYKFTVECKYLSVEKGEVLGIFGDISSGKTLFTMILAGLIKGYFGIIETAMSGPNLTDRKKIGYVPFKNILYENLTVFETVSFFFGRYNIKNSDLKIKAGWFNQFYDIRKLYKRKIFSLTAGELQTVKLFCSLIHSPNLLIIDEPFNGIGNSGIKFFKELFLDLSGKGAAVVFTSSCSDLMKQVSMRSAFISNGRIE